MSRDPELQVVRKSWHREALGEPILHFLLIGGLLFLGFEVFGSSTPADGGGTEIVVDRDAILNFMQYRSNAFEFDFFNQQLEGLRPEELRVLVDEFVREEVLYREALAMGLEQGDYIIRQRLVQKLQFLIEGTSEAGLSPTPAELGQFYSLYQADYVEPPVYTFTHVFFDAEARGDEAARQLALTTLGELNQNHVTFSEASRWGDRPLYFQNYVERTRDFVLGYLGEDLTRGLDEADLSGQVWTGPYRSPYGWHLVLLTRRVPSRLPALAEIEERVAEDYMRVEIDRARRQAIAELIGRYEVEIVGLDVPGPSR